MRAIAALHAPAPDLHSVTQRPIRPDDAERLGRLIERLSPRSRYRRFFSPVHTPPRALLHRLSIVDHDRREAIVAVHGDELVGVASYEGDRDDPTSAEVAVLVDDAWQRLGIARFLLDRLAREARRHGIEQFTASVLADNVPAVAVALARTLNRFARMDGTGPERTLVMPLHRAAAGS